MPVALSNRVRKSGVPARAVRVVAQRLLEAVGRPDATLSLSLVDDAAIRELNRRFRGKDEPTDVLSFPLDEGDLLGDIAISVETARRQAADYDAPLEREIERLLIHGILHLLGHDHLERDERTRMEKEERRLATAIGMPWPY
ncbi:MAG: rRNA maturation RNase YbeY [Candidatus Eremiobacteraeota bacterium]|nr:rRNA maturation RNase YbeY [Candidatus Eremiobacteraeota bacterium]